MAIKIFWGPPGSYKTSSAISEEVLKAYREGRLLVTNIRGMTEQRLRKHVPGEAGDGFSVINLRQNNPADLARMQRWWHWVPFGAVVIFDEIQAIYPPDWSARELHQLDMTEKRVFPDRYEDGELIQEDVPDYVGLIFDMHRHGGWDLIFTTPNIKKVRQEIRGPAECAYKHKNMAILGWRGRFMQFMHLAEDNGNPSDLYGGKLKKIPTWVFNVYDSTATGTVRDSGAGWNIFANPRLLLLFAVLAGCGVLLATTGGPKLGRETPASSPVGIPPADPGRLVPAPAQGLRRAGNQLASPYSAIWRVVGILDNGDGTRIALVASGRVVRRIHGDFCQQLELGWECKLDDGVATWWTGPEPIVDEYQRPREAGSGAASAV